MRWLITVLLYANFVQTVFGRQPFYDRAHPCKVFNEPRHYCIFLPPDYETTVKAYPVIYYFHGHSDRYTLEHYDNGTVVELLLHTRRSLWK
jgi:enterochelin esterase-like enzyme